MTQKNFTRNAVVLLSKRWMKHTILTRSFVAGFIDFLGSLLPAVLWAAPAAPAPVEANQVVEVPLVSAKTYPNAFMDAHIDAVVTQPDGRQLRVPGFWAGGTGWRFRYASDKVGTHSWQVECSDTANAGLHGLNGSIEVVASTSTNPLFLHGPIRVAADHRHFEHADGTPFLWLGDTWWKDLCKRMTWEGFQELTADRKAKGFNVVQIVCGPSAPTGPRSPPPLPADADALIAKTSRRAPRPPAQTAAASSRSPHTPPHIPSPAPGATASASSPNSVRCSPSHPATSYHLPATGVPRALTENRLKGGG